MLRVKHWLRTFRLHVTRVHFGAATDDLALVTELLAACEHVRRMNICTCCRPDCECGNYSDPCPLCEFRAALDKIDPGHSRAGAEMPKRGGTACYRDAIIRRLKRELAALRAASKPDGVCVWCKCESDHSPACPFGAASGFQLNTTPDDTCR